jgi:hypothetical protein
MSDKPTDAQLVLAALQTLTQVAISAARVKWLLNQPERTEAMVQEQLDKTDAMIEQARAND